MLTKRCTKRTLTMAAVGLLSLGLLLAACAPAPAPTVTAPAPTVTVPGPTVTAPAPTVTAPAPTVTVTAPAPTPAAATIMIAGNRPEGGDFALAQGLATFINSDSKFLKAYVLATGGMTDSQQLFVRDQGLRTTGIVNSVDLYNMAGEFKLWGVNGWEPRIIGAFFQWSYIWVTYDGNIKTMKDFKGKTIGVGRESSTTWPVEKAILEAEGVLADVKLQHGGIGGLVTALMDGKVAVADVIFDYIYPNTYSRGAFLEQLATRGDLYFPGATLDSMTKAAKALGAAPFAFKIPALALGPTQTEPVYQLAWLTWWMADKTMDEATVYEITRVMWANLDKFKNFHVAGNGMVPDFVVMSTWPAGEREKWYHPGALKFYKEKGIELKTRVGN